MRSSSLLLVLTLATTGCATVWTGPWQTIPISSSPGGATVTVEPAGLEVTTPTSVRLRRAEAQTLRFEREGYRPETLTLARHVSEQTLGNFWLVWIGWAFALPFMGIDFATGSGWTLRPQQVHVSLEPLGDGSPQRASCSELDLDLPTAGWSARQPGEHCLLVRQTRAGPGEPLHSELLCSHPNPELQVSQNVLDRLTASPSHSPDVAVGPEQARERWLYVGSRPGASCP